MGVRGRSCERGEKLRIKNYESKIGKANNPGSAWRRGECNPGIKKQDKKGTTGRSVGYVERRVTRPSGFGKRNPGNEVNRVDANANVPG